jgi:hypothetical protein
MATVVEMITRIWMNSDNNTNKSLYMDNGMSDANAQIILWSTKNCIVITKCICIESNYYILKL